MDIQQIKLRERAVLRFALDFLKANLEVNAIGPGLMFNCTKVKHGKHENNPNRWCCSFQSL